MAQHGVTDDLWREVEPLLPRHPRQPKGGRPFIPDRACLAGILFVLRSGCAWNKLPVEELGCGSPTTCWRRFKSWTRAGIWKKLWKKILKHLGRKGQLDLSRAVIDSASMRAVFGGSTRDRTRRTGAKTAASDTWSRMRGARR